MSWFERTKNRFLFHYYKWNPNAIPFAKKGENITLNRPSIFSHPDKIRLGSHIYIGPEAYFHTDGGLTINDNVIFGPRVSIYTTNHVLKDAEYLPYGFISEFAETVVESNTWIGAECTILAGVTIGEGAVCAARTVVTKNVPPLAFVAGNPARVLRYRDPQHYLELKRQGKFFVRARQLQLDSYKYIPRKPSEGMMAHSERAQEDYKRFQLDRIDLKGEL